MPRKLTGPKAVINVTNLSWAMVLRLGIGAGWEPQGTQPPEAWEPVEPDGYTSRSWNGRNYVTRSGQRVTDEDAAALGAALEDALLDVPDHDAVGHKVLSWIDFPDRGTLRVLDPTKKILPVEYFSGRNKARLSRFVGFCRAGGFSIT